MRSFFLLFCFNLLFPAQHDFGELTVSTVTDPQKLKTIFLDNYYWHNDTRSLYYRRIKSYGGGSELIRLFLTTMKKQIIAELPYIEHCIWAPDLSGVLITRTEPARDIKTSGNFKFYSFTTNRSEYLTDSDKKQINICFSPNGDHIGFVRENNLFIQNLKTKKEKQLTFDGSPEIRNGHFDWVYEEEFSIIEGWQWSPDGNKIAYWQVDQSHERRYPITFYNALYLNLLTQYYPKAGTNNARVRIGMADINTGHSSWLPFSTADDGYIPRIYWLPDSKALIVLKLNRLQNHLEILKADLETGLIEVLWQERSETWIEINDNFLLSFKGDKFFFTSESDGYRHIYSYDITRKSHKQITRGSWEVRELLAITPEEDRLYFTAAKESPIENHLYSITINSDHLEKLTYESGWHDIIMSPDGRYYIDTYSRFDRSPSIQLYQTGIFETPAVLQEPVYQLNHSCEFITVPVSKNIQLNGWIIKPVDFNAMHQYPLILYVYGGPRNQEVTQEWYYRNLWYFLLANDGFIVACFDNRGTDGRGINFKAGIYKQLGKLETEDQLKAATYLAKLNYIDPERICIWGWSYGGYLAVSCLMQGEAIFKAAVAVSPVTDWHYYDTIYTERYMQTPTLNPEGYKASSLIEHADKLTGSLLLIHGTGDDNVHFQHTIELTDALIEHHKQFQIMIYPDRFHNLRTDFYHTRQHLLQLIFNYFKQNL